MSGGTATVPNAAHPQRPPGGLLRHPDFMKLWTAETISQFGSHVGALAIPVVAIILLRADAFQVALLATIEFLPFILVSLPAGVWVDRLPRRPILIIGDLGRAIALASIPLAWIAGVLTIYQLYVVGFLVGVFTVFFDVAYQAYLPALVDRDQLPEGNAKLDMSRSGAQLAGPGIAGYLIGALTAPVAVVLDALSFVGSALFVFLIRKQEPRPERPRQGDGARPSMRQEIGEGLHYVLRHPFLRNIAASTGTSNLFSQFVFAILLVYLLEDLGLAPETVGLIFAIGNVGFLTGAASASRIARRLGVGRTILFSAFLSGLPGFLVFFAPRDQPAPLLIGAFALGGFAQVVYNVNQVSLRQAITPDRMQGRMNATMRFIVWGTIPVGAIVGGVLATTIGLRETILLGGIGGMFAFVPILISPVVGLRDMPQAPDEDAAKQQEPDLTGPLPEGDDGAVPPGHRPLVITDEARTPDG